MIFFRLITPLLILVIFFSCSTSETANKRFHGMWRLDKFEIFDSLKGTWIDDTLRKGWSGFILYDGKGHMGVHLVPAGYKDFNTGKNADSLNHDELKQLMGFYRSNFVYFSNYELKDTSILHHRLSATEPRNWGNTLIRDFHFNKDTLILAAHENIGANKLRLRWIKL